MAGAAQIDELQERFNEAAARAALLLAWRPGWISPNPFKPESAEALALSSWVTYSSVAQIGPAVQMNDDFHGWLVDQASALRKHRSLSLDWENLAEELEAMAARERRELLERLTTLLAHLLKWKYQPEEVSRRGHSWRVTTTRSRTEIRRLLDSSPGLKGKLDEFLAEAYADARRHAGVEMGLERRQWEALFPETSPWNFDQLADPDFFPTSTLNR